MWSLELLVVGQLVFEFGQKAKLVTTMSHRESAGVSVVVGVGIADLRVHLMDDWRVLVEVVADRVGPCVSTVRGVVAESFVAIGQFEARLGIELGKTVDFSVVRSRRIGLLGRGLGSRILLVLGV